MSQIATLTLGDATVLVDLFGATVVSYQAQGREYLFISDNAVRDNTKPIRGGIPICWPWFGSDHPHIEEHGINHGLVRQQLWQCLAHHETSDSSQMVFSPIDTTSPWWPQGLDLVYQVTLTQSELTLALITRNRSDHPVQLTCALHSYFNVDDISQVTLEGLNNTYLDKVQQYAAMTSPSPYPIAGEVDRVHLCTYPHTLIKAVQKTTRVEHSGHDSIVVWNPGQELGATYSDLNEDDYTRFVCVETAITKGITLAPDSQHCLQQSIKR